MKKLFLLALISAGCVAQPRPSDDHDRERFIDDARDVISDAEDDLESSKQPGQPEEETGSPPPAEEKPLALMNRAPRATPITQLACAPELERTVPAEFNGGQPVRDTFSDYARVAKDEPQRYPSTRLVVYEPDDDDPCDGCDKFHREAVSILVNGYGWDEEEIQYIKVPRGSMPLPRFQWMREGRVVSTKDGYTTIGNWESWLAAAKRTTAAPVSSVVHSVPIVEYPVVYPTTRYYVSPQVIQQPRQRYCVNGICW